MVRHHVDNVEIRSSILLGPTGIKYFARKDYWGKMAFNGKIYIGSDHAGFELKKKVIDFLNMKHVNVVDVGPNSYDKDDDYPDYAKAVCMNVMHTKNKGILICGSGQGMDRTANKFPGISASVCWDVESAIVAKEHGNINVLCLGGRFTKALEAKAIVDIWLNRGPSKEKRHVRRVKKFEAIEKRYRKS